MGRTPKSAESWYFEYEDALTALLEGGLTSYSVGGQTFTKNNISFIQEQMNYWRGQMDAEATGANGTRVVNMGN